MGPLPTTSITITTHRLHCITRVTELGIGGTNGYAIILLTLR